MSVMGFQKSLHGGWLGVVGWGEFHPVLFWIFINFANPYTSPKCFLKLHSMKMYSLLLAVGVYHT